MGKSPELKPETLMLLGAITGKHSRYRQRHDSEKDSNNTEEIIRADKQKELHGIKKLQNKGTESETQEI